MRQSGFKIKFCCFLKQMAESFKNLNGPVYVKKGEKYSFNELLPVPDSLKPISGPVYMHGNTSHNFSEVSKKVDGLKDLCGENPILTSKRPFGCLYLST